MVSHTSPHPDQLLSATFSILISSAELRQTTATKVTPARMHVPVGPLSSWLLMNANMWTGPVVRGAGAAALESQLIRFQVWCEKDTWLHSEEDGAPDALYTHTHTTWKEIMDQENIHCKLAAWLGIIQSDYTHNDYADFSTGAPNLCYFLSLLFSSSLSFAPCL